MKYWLAFFILQGFLFEKAFAVCEVNRYPYEHTFAIDLEKKNLFYYGPHKGLSAIISNCKNSMNQYLQFSLGVIDYYVENDIFSISYDGKIKEESCNLKNEYGLTKRPIEKIQEIVNEKHRFLRECVTVDVFEMSGLPINLKENQENCRVTPTSPARSGYRLNGDYCFIKVNPLNTFEVQLSLREECKDPQFLRERKLKAQDIELSLDMMEVNADNGMSTDSVQIGTRRAKISVLPPKEILPRSVDIGNPGPSFVSAFAGDLHLGDVKIYKAGLMDQIKIDLSYLVDNFSAKTICKNGLCSSISDFHLPIVSRLELYEVKNKKDVLISQWVQASRSPNSWRGQITNRMSGFLDVQFALGKQYKLKSIFSDPYYDWIEFTSQSTIGMPNMNQFKGQPGSDSLQGLGELTPLKEFPPMDQLPGLIGHITDSNLTMEGTLDRLRRIIGTQLLWPSPYQMYCSKDYEKCFKTGETRTYIEFEYQFRADGFSDIGQLNITPQKVIRRSKALGDYQIINPSKSEKICK